MKKFLFLLLISYASKCSGFSRFQGLQAFQPFRHFRTSDSSSTSKLKIGSESTAYSESTDGAFQLQQNQSSGKASIRPRVSKEQPPGIIVSDRYEIKEANRKDLREAAELCIEVFFPSSSSKGPISGNNPLKQFQKGQLTEEQLADLTTRCSKMELNAMFKATDIETGKIVGFVEITVQAGYKYGMGEGVVLNDFRPVLSNLAVDSRCRRQGIGQALEEQCRLAVKSWGYNEIVLQVEELNYNARQFYKNLGYKDLFIDRAARRYDTSGLFLRNVRTSKICMQKYIEIKGKMQAEKKSVFSIGNLFRMLGA